MTAIPLRAYMLYIGGDTSIDWITLYPSQWHGDALQHGKYFMALRGIIHLKLTAPNYSKS